MIVITLGTIIFPFERAVDWLDRLLEAEIINEPVLFQHGATEVTSLHHPLLTCVTSLSKTKMRESIEQASLVIAHGGQGSTRMLADMGVSFVLLPRLKRYGEHVDDHQLLFAQAVEQFGINYCTELSRLATYIKQPPSPFEGELFDAPSLSSYFHQSYHAPRVVSRVPALAGGSREFYYD